MCKHVTAMPKTIAFEVCVCVLKSFVCIVCAVCIVESVVCILCRVHLMCILLTAANLCNPGMWNGEIGGEWGLTCKEIQNTGGNTA